VSKQAAYDLMIQATSCWQGGLWSDALGEKGEDRIAGINERCHAVLRAIVASGDDYYPLRAVEPRIVDAIAKKVRALGEASVEEQPHAAELAALLTTIADASRETIDARRAADVVKDDVAGQPQVDVRNADKVAAANKLRAGAALDRLLHVNAGPFTDEARDVGTLMALDRIEIARGLPKHLKIYAVRTALEDVYGVAAPAVSDDAAAPIPSGTWLSYLTQVAAAAGHPVPSDARDPQNREPLAWTGVLEGFADRLRAGASRFPPGTPLGDVRAAIVARLGDEFRGERVIYEAHAPAFR
jgi:hypothetical protein